MAFNVISDQLDQFNPERIPQMVIATAEILLAAQAVPGVKERILIGEPVEDVDSLTALLEKDNDKLMSGVISDINLLVKLIYYIMNGQYPSQDTKTLMSSGDFADYVKEIGNNIFMGQNGQDSNIYIVNVDSKIQPGDHYPEEIIGTLLSVNPLAA